ncbi:MAG: hypothetical protein WCR91_06615, partial [Sphaerochaetaceae bacterium]
KRSPSEFTYNHLKLLIIRFNIVPMGVPLFKRNADNRFLMEYNMRTGQGIIAIPNWTSGGNYAGFPSVDYRVVCV